MQLRYGSILSGLRNHLACTGISDAHCNRYLLYEPLQSRGLCHTNHQEESLSEDETVLETPRAGNFST